MASDVDPAPDGLPVSVNMVPAQAWNGIERHVSVPWPIWSPRALVALWRTIAGADAVHLHDALYFGNAFAWLFAHMRGVPVVVTQHVGTIPFKSSFLRTVHALANRTLGRLVLSNAHQVVFISPAVQQAFECFCRFHVPPVYWPNGVDAAVYAPDGAVADHQAIVDVHSAGGRVFLFVGRFVEKKGLSVLRELAVALPDDLWIFAGQGPLDPAHWGLTNVFVVRGESGPGLARYYRAADLLVLPSTGEGFPLVVQEAMACGTPVMVGEETAAGCPDARHLMLVEHVGAADTVTRWTRRLSAIRGNATQLADLRSPVAKYAHEHWSWESAAARYAELLDSIAQGKQTL